MELVHSGSTILLWESNNIRATQIWMQSGKPLVKKKKRETERVLVLYKTTDFLHKLPGLYNHRATILLGGLRTCS